MLRSRPELGQGGVVAVQCPYCAESIKDEAVVCKHCDRDLTFFKPVLKRLVALEDRVGRIRKVVPGPADTALSALVLPGILCVLATATTFWVGNTPWRELRDLPYYLVALGVPLLFGVLVGARNRKDGLLGLFNAGLVLGVLDLAVLLVILGSVEGGEYDWPWLLLVFLIGQPVIVTSAGWIVRIAPPPPPTIPKIKKLLRDGRFLLGMLAQIAGDLLAIYSLVEFL